MLSKRLILYLNGLKVEVHLSENNFARNPPTHIVSIQVAGISYIYCHREGQMILPFLHTQLNIEKLVSHRA